MLDDTEPAERGIVEATELIGRLANAPHRLVEGAYVDLLAARAREASAREDGQQS